MYSKVINKIDEFTFIDPKDIRKVVGHSNLTKTNQVDCRIIIELRDGNNMQFPLNESQADEIDIIVDDICAEVKQYHSMTDGLKPMSDLNGNNELRNFKNLFNREDKNRFINLNLVNNFIYNISNEFAPTQQLEEFYQSAITIMMSDTNFSKLYKEDERHRLYYKLDAFRMYYDIIAPMCIKAFGVRMEDIVMSILENKENVYTKAFPQWFALSLINIPFWYFTDIK